MTDEYLIYDAEAPITNALNMQREALYAELTNLAGTREERIDAAFSGIVDFLADVIVAIHQLETGKPPKYRSEVMGDLGPDQTH